MSDYPMETIEEMLSSMLFVLVHMSHFYIDEIVKIEDWDVKEKKLKYNAMYLKKITV